MSCACVVSHSPPALQPHFHHVVPQAWIRAGARPADPEQVELCPTTHDATHAMLNEYVYHGGLPPWDDHRHSGDRAGTQRPGRRRYNRAAQRLAAEAWALRPSAKPPYTALGG